jgi:hypothetical protein
MVSFRLPLHPDVTHRDVPFVWTADSGVKPTISPETLAAIGAAVAAALPPGRIAKGKMIGEISPEFANSWRQAALKEQTDRWGR